MYLSRAKTYILILLLYSLPVLVHAQQDFTVKGIIFIKSSSERVSQAIITNTRSHDIMMSDELGGFTIKAAKGDTLLFNRLNYTPQKLVITGSDDIAVYLQPVIHLADV